MLEGGSKAKYYFVADILDAFDSVPLSHSQYSQQLSQHLGKPLCNVPDPQGCCASFGDHFLNEAVGIMKLFHVEAEIKRASDLYAAGAFDSRAAFFLENSTQAAKITAESSMRETLGPDWSPIMPICGNCGRIATTRVVTHSGEAYGYVCDKDVKYAKGCGHKGTNKLTDHMYKLTWRLHWPAWMEYFGTSIEGAGVDHHTKGGSWDTLARVFREMFNKEPPITFKFGFILFQGKKYSKSKGIGMGLSDLLNVLPVEVISYALLRPDLQENIDINPNSQNMLRLIEDYSAAMQIDPTSQQISRAERKRAIAARLSSPEGLRWKFSFIDLLLYYELYRDWGTVAQKLSDNKGVEALKPYAIEWKKQNLAPPEYSFEINLTKLPEGAPKTFISSLVESDTPEQIHNKVFEAAKNHSVAPAEIFKGLYLHIIDKEHGPKLGKLVYAIGVNKIKTALL